MDQFSTREIASITWGTILIMAVVFSSIKMLSLEHLL